MAKMPPVVMEMLNANPVLPKVLTTCDADGNMNTVPKETLYAVDNETIIFADLWGYKTNDNLKANGKVVVAVFSIQVLPIGYQIKGTFQGFESSGKLFDIYTKRVKEQLNMDIPAVGVIKVDTIFALGPPEPGLQIA
jgi:predicted pyridoxine 5'-phosphate oxidase superfamily flavin-nucleotide-binding protein